MDLEIQAGKKWAVFTVGVGVKAISDLDKNLQNIYTSLLVREKS